MWKTPIYDRTYSDVRYADQHRDSPLPLKGARNHTDLERITGNIHFLSAWLLEYGYSAPTTCKTDWTLGEVPQRAEINKIRTDVLTLRRAFFVMRTTPSTPELPYTHYQKINDIERILFDIEVLIENMLRTVDFAWTLGMAHTGIYGGL